MPDNIQLLGIEFDATNLVSGLNKVAQRLDKLEEQFDSTGKAGKKLNTRIAELEKKLRETSIANRALEKAQRGLNFQLDRYKKKVENATTAIAALKNKNKELNASLRETQRANDLLAKNLARVEVRVTKLQKKAITAAAALATLRDKNKQLSAALRLSERETKKLQSTVTKLAARVDRLEKQFKNAQTRINQYRVAAKRAGTETSGLGAKVIALTAGFLALRAISSALRGLFGVNRDFQQLQAQLIAVTGGLENAARAFRQLTRFAVETPFEVQNLVRAFTQLSAVGVPATTDTLRRFGDFASAFGEDITVFTNAVIRGAAGETEALKRFGVTASVQGNAITVQFRDFTRTTKRNFTDVTEVFKELSALNFEGAMTRQMETIIGSISNLKDAGSLLAFAIGERGGMNEAFIELVETLIVAVQATDRYAEAIGGGFAKAMGVATGTIENMIEHSEGIIKSFQALGGALLAIGGIRVLSGLGKTALALRALTLAHPVTAVLGLAFAIGTPLLLAARKADKQMADMVGTARKIGSIALVGEVERYAKEMDALAESLHRASKAAPRRSLFSTGIEPHILNLQAAAVKEYAIQLEKMFGILKAGQSGTLKTGQLVGLLPEIAEQVVAEKLALQRLQEELEDRPTGAEGRKSRREGRTFRSTDVIKKEAAYYQERLSLAQGYFNSVNQLAADQLAAERAAAKGKDNDDARTAFLRLQRFERLVTALEVEKLALTEGAEASLRYKLATDDLTGSFQETIVALTQEVEGLREVEKARADAQAEQIRLVEENARAVDDRKRSVEALLQSQEEEIFALQFGSEALDKYKFRMEGATAADVAAYEANQQFIKGIEDRKLAYEALNEAIKEQEQRTQEVQNAIEQFLLRTGRNVKSLGDLVTGVIDEIILSFQRLLAAKLAAGLTDALTGLLGGGEGVSGALSAFGPFETPNFGGGGNIFGGQRPGLASTAATILNFSYAPSVSAIDARGVGEFLNSNKGALAATVADALGESGALAQQLRGGR